MMTHRTDIALELHGGARQTTRGPVPRFMPLIAAAAAVIAAILGPVAPVAAASAVGDAYVYRLVNGYNKEVLGQLRYQVAKVDSAGITVSVTPDRPGAGVARTNVYTPEGNWLRHPVESHGESIEYEFATAYPAYVFPLELRKSWSVRVNARVPGEQRTRSVRVDGRVLGSERVRVPAGEFDTVKVRRFVYPGDTGFMLSETRITEVDWYAPALGRAVRTERISDYLDFNRCPEEGPCDARGAWEVLELVEVRAATR